MTMPSIHKQFVCPDYSGNFLYLFCTSPRYIFYVILLIILFSIDFSSTNKSIYKLYVYWCEVSLCFLLITLIFINKQIILLLAYIVLYAFQYTFSKICIRQFSTLLLRFLNLNLTLAYILQCFDTLLFVYLIQLLLNGIIY